ncbi:MAG: hypothetical protein Q9160_003691 [Pyrenula sp. 1 TL-2023]
MEDPKQNCKCSEELSSQYPSRSTRLLVLPALTTTLKAIEEDVSNPDIASLNLVILVNNIGGLGDFVSPQYMPVWSYTADQVDSLLNVSSAMTSGGPYIAIYTATKAHVNALSRGLAAEFSAKEGHQRVDVMSLALGNTKSGCKFHTELRHPILHGLCDTETAARTDLDRVGCGKVVGSGWWLHELQRRMFNLSSEKRKLATITKMMKKLKGKDFAQKEGSGPG